MRTGNGGGESGTRWRAVAFLLPALAFVLTLACSAGWQGAPLRLDICESAATPDARSLAALAHPPKRSELFDRLGVTAWHDRGWRGRGIKVAVLDSGFHGYRQHLGAALPATVKVRSFRFDGNLEAKESQHGILCAEVIHAIAPEAEIFLTNWEPENPEQFLAAVRWVRQEGARILSCSIIMPTWSDCAGHGRIHEELTQLLGTAGGAGDALFFACAGNTAQRHWSGAFEDGGDGYHVWQRTGGAAQTVNSIRPWGGERVSVELCCPADADYELIVTDAADERIIGRAVSENTIGCGTAVVAFVPERGCEYRLRVRQLRSCPGGFHLAVLGGGLRWPSSRGSIPFPGDGAEVIAVGAVDENGRRLGYSSCGSREGGLKPDFAAAVPFPSAWRSRPFAGTSAAAPQAAGLAALIWSRSLAANASFVHTALKNSAHPCSSPNRPWETGRGTIQLPAPKEAGSHGAIPASRNQLKVSKTVSSGERCCK